MTNGPSTFDGAEVDKLIEDLGYLTPKQQLLLKAFIGYGIDRLEVEEPDAPDASNLPLDEVTPTRSIKVENPDQVGDWSAIFNRAFVPNKTDPDRRTDGGKVGGSGVQFRFPTQ
jgi:hypothetical protein